MVYPAEADWLKRSLNDLMQYVDQQIEREVIHPPRFIGHSTHEIVNGMAHESRTERLLLDHAKGEVVRTLNIFTAMGRYRQCVNSRVWRVIDEATRTPLDADLDITIVVGRNQRFIRTKTLVFASGGNWELRLRDWASPVTEVVYGTYRREGAGYTWQRQSPHWTQPPRRLPYPLSDDEGFEDTV